MYNYRINVSSKEYHMIKIALIDDDPITRRIVSEFLSSSIECEVIHSASGEEFLEKIGVSDIDIVLLDIILPGKNGLEVHTELS